MRAEDFLSLESKAKKIQLSTVRHLLHAAPVELKEWVWDDGHGRIYKMFVSAPLGHELPIRIDTWKSDVWFCFAGGRKVDEDDLPDVYGTGDTEFEALQNAASAAGLIHTSEWEKFIPTPTPAEAELEERIRCRIKTLLAKDRIALHEAAIFLAEKHGLRTD